jgi:excisionase family DNA binding protein
MPELMDRAAEPRPTPLASEFLSRREVARLFGVSTSTVTRWARAGLLATIRTPGGHYRFRAGETLRAAQVGSADARRPD